MNFPAKSLIGCAIVAASTLSASNCWATEYQIAGLSIKMIRAVGQYSDPAFRDTLELWFTTPVVFPAGTGCVETRRVYIDAQHYHLIAAAQLAFAKGRQVNVTVDTALPIRAGACEISFLDVEAG